MGNFYFNDFFAALQNFKLIVLRLYSKRNIVYSTPMRDLPINPPYVDSRVDSITFTMGDPMPESMIFCIKRLLKAAGISQNCHILVFFRGFRRGKDHLR